MDINYVIQISLKALPSPPSKWLDSDKGVKTRLMNDKSTLLNSKVTLKNGEFPVFEYSDKRKYSLITSERVFFTRDGNLEELFLDELVNVRRYFIDGKEFGGPYQFLRLFKEGNSDVLLVEFDSGHPGYFAYIFLKNVCSKQRKGYWALNPGGERIEE